MKHYGDNMANDLLEKAFSSIANLARFLVNTEPYVVDTVLKLSREKRNILDELGIRKIIYESKPKVKIKEDIVSTCLLETIYGGVGVSIVAAEKGTKGTLLFGRLDVRECMMNIPAVMKAVKLEYIEIMDKEVMEKFLNNKHPIEDYVVIEKTKFRMEDEVEVLCEEYHRLYGRKVRGLEEKIKDITVKHNGANISVSAVYSNGRFEKLYVKTSKLETFSEAETWNTREKYVDGKIIYYMNKWFISKIPEMTELAVKQIIKYSESLW